MKSKIITVFAIIIIALNLSFGQTSKSNPEIFGYMKAWYYNDSDNNRNEFNVKNVRIGMKGKLNNFISYRVFTDVAVLGSLNKVKDDDGKIKDVSAKFSEILLDAFLDFKISKSFLVKFGQFKTPFSTENLRSPVSSEFVSRPLMTDYVNSLRDIGILASYNFENLPLQLTGSLINGAGQNKAESDKTLNHTFRAVYEPFKKIMLSANYYGGKFNNQNISIYNLGAHTFIDNINIDCEYSQKKSELPGTDLNSNSLFVYAIYGFETGNESVSRIEPAIRFEIHDPNSELDNDKIQKITAGLSFVFSKESYSLIRINYEHTEFANAAPNTNTLYAVLQIGFLKFSCIRIFRFNCS